MGKVVKFPSACALSGSASPAEMPLGDCLQQHVSLSPAPSPREHWGWGWGHAAPLPAAGCIGSVLGRMGWEKKQEEPWPGAACWDGRKAADDAV